jgi:Tfp pilus assembly protein PilP
MTVSSSRAFRVLAIAILSTSTLSASQAPGPDKGPTAQKASPGKGATAQKASPERGATTQTTAPAKGGATTAAPPNTDQLIEPPGFAYVPERRRDPFVSLLRRGSDTRAAASGTRPSGLGGLGAEEITLRGTVRSREGFVGILQGADQKTYIVRAGDKLFDGTIRTISQNDLVIVQQVNDPLSLEKQREVRKVLRQIEAK